MSTSPLYYIIIYGAGAWHAACGMRRAGVAAPSQLARGYGYA
jgi:hypothetical protein